MRYLKVIVESMASMVAYFRWNNQGDGQAIKQSLKNDTLSSEKANKQSETLNIVTTSKVMRYLSGVFLVTDNLPRLGLAAMLTACSTGFNFLSPYLFSETIKLLSSEDETVTIGGVEFDRFTLISALIASYTLAQCIPNFRDQALVSVTSRTVKEVLMRNTTHLLNRNLDYHVNTLFSDQMFFMQKGFSVYSTGVPLVTQITPMMIEIMIACSILSSRYGVEMGLGLFGLLGSYTLYCKKTTPSIIALREKSLLAGSGVHQSFSRALEQYKNMRDFNKYDETIKEVESAIRELTKAEVVSSLRPLEINLGHIAISRITILLAALMVGLGVKSKKYTANEFVIIVGYFNQLAHYLPSFGSAINQFFSSYPDLKYIVGELQKPIEVVDRHPDVLLKTAKDEPAEIKFENVSFSYTIKENGKPKLPMARNITFTIEPGQRVALISESGAGKTTLFNLLFRYYQPDEGVIKINGQAIDEVSLFDLQKNITIIEQKPQFFKGTIRENILYGAPEGVNYDDEAILAIAESVNLKTFLTTIEGGLDADMGERGKKLSGGQQQKVAILRGLMKPCQIRLLDEITASLDSQAASAVLQGLFSLPKQPTTLMITHKLTEAQLADKILVIDKGRCVAEGKHEVLLETCELYQRLWEGYTNACEEPQFSSYGLKG